MQEILFVEAEIARAAIMAADKGSGVTETVFSLEGNGEQERNGAT